MIELEVSAVTARAHARQLRWLLERCKDKEGGAAADASDEALNDIADMISRAEHLADFRDEHDTDDHCPHCPDTGNTGRLPLIERLPSRRWLRFEAAWQLLHVADESLIAVAPDRMVRARAPEIAVQARRWLGPDDARMHPIADLMAVRPDAAPAVVTDEQRYALAGLMHAIHFTWDRSYARARSFRHLILVACLLLGAAVSALVLVGVLAPAALPLCTTDLPRVCATGRPDPSGGDIALVALIGAIAAGFSAVASIGNLRPLVDPYRTPTWQGVLKVPTGAFTALLGVLAVEQGLQATAGLPSSQGGILVMAFVFGYSQQLVTRSVDSYGSQIRAGLAGQRTRGGVAQEATAPPL